MTLTLPRLARLLLLLKCVDQLDGREEADTSAMMFDCLNANRRGRMRLVGARAADYQGYFGYNDNFKAYIEVISFDRLLNAARERNRAFFDKPGLPTT
jgi:hypothetical protein